MQNQSEKEIKDFYQKLRKKIKKQLKKRKKETTGKKSFYDNLVDYLILLPDLFHLSFKLLFDKTVPSENKGALVAGIAYVIAPIDIIPDSIPIAGWIDDLIVITMAINKFLESENNDVKAAIDRHWAGEENVFIQVKEILKIADAAIEFLPHKFMKIIKSMFPRR
ncbi:MAG: DUF1232 domain-containing protein [FCB group bacterium]|nr:DUF1232 domain-containing protein [FCB group bacterium]